MNDKFDISVVQLACAFFFVLVVFVVLKLRGIKREGLLLLASMRMTIQLILAGYVLVYVFNRPNPFITIAFLSIMQIFFYIYNFKKV